MEHTSPRRGAEYVASADRPAATITAHHLLYNRNAIFTGGIRPHYYCLPVLKRETTAWRWCRRPPAATPSSFWAPTARRTRAPEGARHRLRWLLHRARRHGMYAQAFDAAGALDKSKVLPVSSTVHHSPYHLGLPAPDVGFDS